MTIGQLEPIQASPFRATRSSHRPNRLDAASGPWEPNGPGDDWVAHNIAVFNYAQLGLLVQKGPVSGFRYLDLNGGGEGRYWLRWHLEFDPNASNSFDARFTHWDELVVADIRDGPEAEIITFCDEDAQGNLGLARVYNHSGQLKATFATLFTPYDRIAIGNVFGTPDPDGLEPPRCSLPESGERGSLRRRPLR